MSQKEEPPSFLDDPAFLAELSELDRGLAGPDPKELDHPRFRTELSELDRGLGGPASAFDETFSEESKPAAPAELIAPASPAGGVADESPANPATDGAPAAPPLSIFPESTLAAGSTTTASAAPRPLLDLFPPPVGRERARHPAGSGRPAVSGAPAPRIIRSRFALKADSLPAPDEATYEAFYGLSENPFALSPAAKFLYHSTSHDRAVQELVDALGRGDAMMLLTGEMGVGKTTLCQSVVERLGRRTVTSFIADPVGSFEDLLRTVLVDFGVVAREDAARGRMAVATRQELVAAVGDFAASLAPLQASAVVIVDEAHDVSPELLEPLSALSEATLGDRRVQIILAGQPALASLLRRRELRALERQVAVRCRLDPLTPDEVINYVVHRIAIVGVRARVEFSESALAEVHAATRGVPRLVNLVCDRALTRGHQASASVIDDELVAAAADDLKLVPLRSDARRIVTIAVRVVVLLALLLTGAGAAAWVFRAEVSQILGR